MNNIKYFLLVPAFLFSSMAFSQDNESLREERTIDNTEIVDSIRTQRYNSENRIKIKSERRNGCETNTFKVKSIKGYKRTEKTKNSEEVEPIYKEEEVVEKSCM